MSTKSGHQMAEQNDHFWAQKHKNKIKYKEKVVSSTATAITRTTMKLWPCHP
jgi:hypothetical protein